MGIDGERLSATEMASRGYTLSATDFHFTIELPVGGPDGYYKVRSLTGFVVESNDLMQVSRKHYC